MKSPTTPVGPGSGAWPDVFLSLFSDAADAEEVEAAAVESMRLDRTFQGWRDRFGAGARDSFEGLGGDLAQLMPRLRDQLRLEKAAEVMLTTLGRVLSSRDLAKAYQSGQIIGGTLASQSPNWADAESLIRSLHQLDSEDVANLDVFLRFQRPLGVVLLPGGGVGVATEPNLYDEPWARMLKHVGRGIARDVWDSACARLAGVGLAAIVSTHRETRSPVYRLTGRGRRLLQLLGRNVDHALYRATWHHDYGGEKTVWTEEEAQELGAGWSKEPPAKTVTAETQRAAEERTAANQKEAVAAAAVFQAQQESDARSAAAHQEAMAAEMRAEDRQAEERAADRQAEQRRDDDRRAAMRAY